MDLRPDPVQAQLRRALRAGLHGAAAHAGVCGPPTDDGPASLAACALAEVGAALFELPAAAGGLDLGLAAGVTVSMELGRAACGNPYRAGALVADTTLTAGRTDVLDRLLNGSSVALAGMAALPPGSDVQAMPADGGWELTGTVAADMAGTDMVAVACQVGGVAALALVSGSAVRAEPQAGWPPVLSLDRARAGRDDVFECLTDSGTGPLARARVRQAAYLLGLGTGMLTSAVDYVSHRRQSGSSLRDMQAVAFPLARGMIALRAAGMGVDRAAWLLDTGCSSGAPVEALAAAAEAARSVARVSMQACGVRAMTADLPLHRYYRLVGAESACFGRPAELWQLAGAARLAERAAARPTRAA